MMHKAYPTLLANSPKVALQNAETFFREAYNYFNATDHYKGMYHVKKHEAELLSDPEYDRLSKRRDQGTQTFHAIPVESNPPMKPSLRSRKNLAEEALHMAKIAKSKY